MSASDPSWEIPDYVVTPFRPRSKPFALCIPVINEGEKIRAQLRKLKDYTSLLDIYIADGGSTDGSLDPDLLLEVGVSALLTKRGPGRLSAQLRMGLAFGLDQGYEGIVLMDGNGKDDPAALPEFVNALADGFDHIQGSRFVKGGKAVRTPWMRYAGIRLLHAPLISWAAGFPYTDTTNGFRAYSRRFLLDPHVAPFRALFSGYELHYYLAIRAPRLGYRSLEIPVTRQYPLTGKTPTKISPLRGNALVLKTLFQACLGRYNPSHD